MIFQKMFLTGCCVSGWRERKHICINEMLLDSWLCNLFTDFTVNWLIELTRLFSIRLHPGSLTVGLVRQCQTIHGRDRICIPPQLPPEWITTLFFIILGIISLTVTCGLLFMSRWHRDAAHYARWIAFTGSRRSLSPLILFHSSILWILNLL